MFLLQACSYKNKVDSNYYCQKLRFSCIQSNKKVNFKTSKGDFEVELFGKDNPVTVSNFLENIDNDIYVNQKFYKIMYYPQIKFIFLIDTAMYKTYLGIVYYFVKFLIYVNTIVYVLKKI